MSDDKIISKLSLYERKVFPFLGEFHSVDKLVDKSKLKEVEVMRALQWLQNKKLVNIDIKSEQIITLKDNGIEYIKKGLPEKRFLNALIDSFLDLDKLAEKSELNKNEINVCLGLLKKKGAIEFDKKGKTMKISITSLGKKMVDKESLEEQFLKKTFPLKLEELSAEERFAYESLIKRKEILELDTVKNRIIELTELGKDLQKKGISNEKYIDLLTPAMLKGGSWKDKKFRSYDIKSDVPKIYPGKKHFVNQVKKYAKQIWLDMGFEEMTGDIVNSCFWNFDSLFVPQDHPAREMQDTFFIKGSEKVPKQLMRGVKEQHEKSWKYKWDEKVCQKKVLRTHTTVLSAKTIAKLTEGDLPKKYFAIGRNYRNEALDWSHLFEFNQSEGIVVDKNANFGNLLGYLEQFFKKMGYDKVRFRPAYFPYTEPSVEIDVYDSGRKTWIELGGAGIFRPEVVEPLFGKYIPVLAWGFGLGRILCPYYGIKDLREFYKNDLKQLKEVKEWL